MSGYWWRLWNLAVSDLLTSLSGCRFCVISKPDLYSLCFELFEQRDLLYQYLQKFRPFQATLENSTREKKTK